MRISIVTSGTRGDVQPYAALGLALREEGHDVLIAGHARQRELVESVGLRFRTVGVERNVMLEDPAIREVLSGETAGPLQFLRKTRLLADVAESMARRLLADAAAACVDSEVLLCAAHNFYVGEGLAAAHECKLAYGSLQPITPTRFHPSILFPACPSWIPQWGQAVYNILSHYVTLQPIWFLSRHRLNRLRRDVLGLSPLAYSPRALRFADGALRLHGYSPIVLPRPSDWSANQHVTGYWFLKADQRWQPPRELQQFLDAGPPPVFVGFSSVIDPDGAASLTDMLIEALQLTGQRALFATGYGAVTPRVGHASHVMFVDDVPHAHVLPYCRAVIHHGGAGTTGAVLRAGLPSVIIPFVSDQFFWARRVHALAACPRPLRRSQLTVPALVHVLRAVVAEGAMRERCRHLGTALSDEDGVGAALALLRASSITA